MVAAILGAQYASSKMDPERKAARELARSAIYVRKVSMIIAEINIREPLYAEKFRELNEL